MLFWQGCRPVPESAGAFFVQGLSWDRNDRFDESVSLLRVAPIRAVLAARRGRAPAGVRRWKRRSGAMAQKYKFLNIVTPRKEADLAMWQCVQQSAFAAKFKLLQSK